MKTKLNTSKHDYLIRIFFFVFLNVCVTFLLSAQSVFSGNVKNETGEAIIGTITVQAKNSLIIAGFTRSDANGKYTVGYEGKADSIVLTVSGMLIGKHSKVVVNKSQRVDFVIKEQALKLKEVNLQ